MLGFIADLGVSDVCNGWPGTGAYARVQGVHFGLGIIAGFAPFAVRIALLAGWVCKEAFSDIGGCGLSGVVVLDSVADMAFAALGVAVVVWRAKGEVANGRNG